MVKSAVGGKSIAVFANSCSRLTRQVTPIGVFLLRQSHFYLTQPFPHCAISNFFGRIQSDFVTFLPVLSYLYSSQLFKLFFGSIFVNLVVFFTTTASLFSSLIQVQLFFVFDKNRNIEFIFVKNILSLEQCACGWSLKNSFGSILHLYRVAKCKKGKLKRPPQWSNWLVLMSFAHQGVVKNLSIVSKLWQLDIIFHSYYANQCILLKVQIIRLISICKLFQCYSRSGVKIKAKEEDSDDPRSEN